MSLSDSRCDDCHSFCSAARPNKEVPMATIADIAQAAGVSKSTVSRSFTRPDSVNAETRERILAVAAQLGYTPAPTKAEVTGTIALFIPDIANPYYTPLVKAIQAACR